MVKAWVLVVGRLADSSNSIPNMQQCRDTVIIRPHPGVWRVVHGVGMLYLMCLAVLLVHDKAGARCGGVAVMPPFLDCGVLHIHKSAFLSHLSHPPPQPQPNPNRDLVRIFVPDIGPVPPPRQRPGDAFDCSINAATIWRQLTEIWYDGYGWIVAIIILLLIVIDILRMHTPEQPDLIINRHSIYMNTLAGLWPMRWGGGGKWSCSGIGASAGSSPLASRSVKVAGMWV